MKRRHAMLMGLGAAACAGVASTFLRHAKAPPAPGVMRLIDGEVIHYVDRGEGPAIVFLHGFGGSTYSWRHILDRLAAHHRVVALDFPGFGLSDRSSAIPLGHEAHARRVTRLMDSLGIDSATVIGHSMGGAIAQRMAAMFPERVDRLVLVASVNAGTRETWDRASARLRGMYALGPIIERNPWLVRRIVSGALRQMAHDPASVTDETVEAYAWALGRAGSARGLVRLAKAAREESTVDLSRIQAPTLVISGSNDGVVPVSIGELLSESIPGAHHVVMDDAGHLLPEEAPERFQALLEAFLSGAIPAEEASSR